MTDEEREAYADTISKKIVQQLWEHPNILGFHGLGWRDTSGLEADIYGWLMDHATFQHAKEDTR